MPDDLQYPADKYLLLGKIARAHGLRGEVKIYLHSGQPENIRNYRELFLVDQAGVMHGPLSLIRSRNQGRFAIVQFAAVTTRSQAEEMEGLEVLLAKTELPALSEDEYYWHEYIGRSVSNTSGEIMGRIIHIFRNGMQDVLVMKRVGTDEEVLIPMTRKIIVGETAEELTIDPPPGLLEINAAS